MVNTTAKITRPTKGVILTVVAIGIFAIALSNVFVVSPRDVMALSVIFAVFVAMSIGIGMALIDVVKYFESHRT